MSFENAMQLPDDDMLDAPDSRLFLRNSSNKEGECVDVREGECLDVKTLKWQRFSNINIIQQSPRPISLSLSIGIDDSTDF